MKIWAGIIDEPTLQSCPIAMADLPNVKNPFHKRRLVGAGAAAKLCLRFHWGYRVA